MIFERRGVWYAYNKEGVKHRFLTRQEAVDFLGPQENLDAEKEDINQEEESGLEAEEAQTEGLQQAEEDSEPPKKVAYSFGKSWNKD